MSLINLTGVGCLRIHVYSNKIRKTKKKKRKKEKKKNIKNNFTKKQYKEFPMIYITGEQPVCSVSSVVLERVAVEW